MDASMATDLAAQITSKFGERFKVYAWTNGELVAGSQVDIVHVREHDGGLMSAGDPIMLVTPNGMEKYAIVSSIKSDGVVVQMGQRQLKITSTSATPLVDNNDPRTRNYMVIEEL